MTGAHFVEQLGKCTGDVEGLEYDRTMAETDIKIAVARMQEAWRISPVSRGSQVSIRRSQILLIERNSMTVDTTSGGSVVPYDDSNVGLEDVGVGDVVIPRLRIVHDEAMFEDNLSKAKFSTMKVVLLGLVKQRIFWDDNVEDDDKPLCKSPDFEHGFPNVDPGQRKTFPWAKSNFTCRRLPARWLDQLERTRHPPLQLLRLQGVGQGQLEGSAVYRAAHLPAAVLAR